MDEYTKSHIKSIFRSMILSILIMGFVFGVLATMLLNLIFVWAKE